MTVVTQNCFHQQLLSPNNFFHIFFLQTTCFQNFFFHQTSKKVHPKTCFTFFVNHYFLSQKYLFPQKNVFTNIYIKKLYFLTQKKCSQEKKKFPLKKFILTANNFCQLNFFKPQHFFNAQNFSIKNFGCQKTYSPK